MKTIQIDIDNFMLFIKDLIFKRFYGTIEIKLENGKIVFIRKIETIKNI